MEPGRSDAVDRGSPKGAIRPAANHSRDGEPPCPKRGALMRAKLRRVAFLWRSRIAAACRAATRPGAGPASKMVVTLLVLAMTIVPARAPAQEPITYAIVMTAAYELFTD